MSKQKRYGYEKHGWLTVYEINKALKFLSKKLSLKHMVTREYHEFLPLFSEAAARALPPRHTYHHKITLKEGCVGPVGPLYSLSRTELVILRDWIQDNLTMRLIRASHSPCGAPIMFAQKSDGILRLCIHYRRLNEGTLKNQYPLLLIQDTLL